MSQKIYYLTTEIIPFAEVSPIAEFSTKIPLMLQGNGHDIRTIIPKYGFISERKYILREVIRLKDLKINFQNKEHSVNLKSGFIPNTRVQLYFMEHLEYFTNISELLYKSRNGRVYNNNHEKFVFFVKAVMDSLDKLFWFPDIIICNDWQMSFLPILFASNYKNLDRFKKTKIVSMIHSFNSLYNFQNVLFKSLSIKFNARKKFQNTFELALQFSDLVYIFDDGKILNDIKKNRKLNSLLKNTKHIVINLTEIEDNSDKIDLYNKIKDDLKSLVK